MSFVKTLATLAAGFAAAKGYDAFRKGGGMAGLQERMKDNPALAGMAGSIDKTLEKLGLPGGTDAVTGAVAKAGETAQKGGAAAVTGLGGLMAALGGAMAGGAASAGAMIDQMTGTTAVTATTEANARLMIRAMIEAAKADGTVDDEERARIMAHLGDASDDERAFVEAAFAAPSDPAALAADTAAAARTQVYTAAAMAVRVDHPAEVAYLQSLASALDLDAATVAGLHAAMGLPAQHG
jgi:uncharacterized membrane protein YebE (DUF533 family)